MITRKFNPREILFSPSALCNLRCAHCDNTTSSTCLPTKTAVKFLNACARAGITRVGFTGGEPFLKLDFLCALSRAVLRHDMLFSRIMTNAAWFKTKKELAAALTRLFRAGYDGDICISVDAFHRQDLRKVACFIQAATAIWRRPDIISLAVVFGCRDSQSIARLKKLARILRARLIRNPHGYCIKNEDVFIKIFPISLSPVDKAARLKNPWDGTWFKDDFCKGPGNVFFVLPDGSVKPCCGYGNDNSIFTIGSIHRDSPQKLLRNARKNYFVSAVFRSGLHPIRRALERSGIRFPGKTSNHCFFCHYLADHVARADLASTLRR